MSGIKNSWKYEKDLLIIFNMKILSRTIIQLTVFILNRRLISKKINLRFLCNYMKSLNFSNNTNISFGRIILTKDEKTKSDSLLNSLAISDVKKSQVIKNDLFELYESHIYKDVESKVKSYHYKEDFLQEVMLKFFEVLDSAKSKLCTTDSLINLLNDIKPGIQELQYNIVEKSLDKKVSDNVDLSKLDLFTVNDLPVYASSPTDSEKKLYKETLSNLLQNTTLDSFSSEVVKQRGAGLNYVEISKNIGASAQSVRNRCLKSLLKIQKANGLLPKNFLELVANFSLKYNVQNIDKIMTLFIEYPYLYSLGQDNLFEKINLNSQLLGINDNDFVSLFQKYPILLQAKSETLDKNLKNNSKLLGLSKEDFITKFVFRHPPLLVKNSEYLKKNIEQSSVALGISEEEFIAFAQSQPVLLTINSSKLAKTAETNAKILCMDRDQFLKYIKNDNSLLFISPDKIQQKIKEKSDLLGISESQFKKIMLKAPRLISIHIENLAQNIDACAELLSLDKPSYISLCLKSPSLLSYSSQSLEKNLNGLSVVLDLQIKDLVKKLYKFPQLFCMNPETIKNKITESATSLGIDRNDYIKMAFLCPELLYAETHTLLAKKDDFCKLLELTDENFYKMIKAAPWLLIRNPQSALNLIEECAQALNVTKKEMVDVLLTRPSCLYYKADSIVEKINLFKYKEKIKGGNVEKLTLSTSSKEQVYLQILSVLLKRHFGLNSITTKNMDQFLTNNSNDIYKFDLPKSDFNEEFIEFVQKYFEKYIENPNLSFIIN